MPDGVAAESAAATAPAARTIWRLREAAVCMVLTALVFLQEPGKIVADSKIDLAVNPSGWLFRALHLWEPGGSFGQLQNQAYGYLWPMGPFFAAGSALGIPAWAVQRLWWTLIVCVAFIGLVRLAEALHSVRRPRDSSAASRSRSRRDLSPNSGRCRSKPGPAPSRRGSCCR